LTFPEEIFIDARGKNLGFLGKIFQTQTQTKDGLTQPEQQKFDPTQPGSKILTRAHQFQL